MSNEYLFDRNSEEEFEALNILHQANFNDFGERLLKFPSAMTFYTNKKNRYPNILPKEQTRIRLSVIPGVEGSDYINANLLTDSYIACQAPLPATFGDFWRMVWEQDTAVIVMLTKLSENGYVKADKYWPDEIGETLTFPLIAVTLVSVYRSEDVDIIIRVLTLRDSMGSERTVVQLQYLGWPDFGVPDSSDGILQLIEITNLYKEFGVGNNLNGPIVVHCSAGCGRSGSFIAIHQLLEQYNSGCKISLKPTIFNAVSLMRTQRDGMVQTKEQYNFVYKVLRDYLELQSKPSIKEKSIGTINKPIEAGVSNVSIKVF